MSFLLNSDREGALIIVYQKRAATAYLQLTGLFVSSCSPCWMFTADAQSYRILQARRVPKKRKTTDGQSVAKF